MPDRPSLWWAYDEEDQSFSALPAGPMLVPALFIAALAFGFDRLKTWASQPDNVLGRDFTSTPEYQSMRKRYFELINKKHYGPGLETHEQYELEQLKRPYWIQSGTWSYYP